VNYLVDTNVVSEFPKPGLDPNVERWISDTPENQIWLSAITFTELRIGIDSMAGGRRRTLLLSWFENDLPARFEGRIISVGVGVADVCGSLMARSQKLGRALELADGLLAATAETHGMTLVTRNTKHFENLGIRLLNPWLGSSSHQH